MLDHVSIGISDIQQSRRFHDTALRPLGLACIVDFGVALTTALHLGPSGSNLRSHLSEFLLTARMLRIRSGSNILSM